VWTAPGHRLVRKAPPLGSAVVQRAERSVALSGQETDKGLEYEPYAPRRLPLFGMVRRYTEADLFAYVEAPIRREENDIGWPQRVVTGKNDTPVVEPI